MLWLGWRISSIPNGAHFSWVTQGGFCKNDFWFSWTILTVSSLWPIIWWTKNETFSPRYSPPTVDLLRTKRHCILDIGYIGTFAFSGTDHEIHPTLYRPHICFPHLPVVIWLPTLHGRERVSTVSTLPCQVSWCYQAQVVGKLCRFGEKTSSSQTPAWSGLCQAGWGPRVC